MPIFSKLFLLATAFTISKTLLLILLAYHLKIVFITWVIHSSLSFFSQDAFVPGVVGDRYTILARYNKLSLQKSRRYPCIRNVYCHPSG